MSTVTTAMLMTDYGDDTLKSAVLANLPEGVSPGRSGQHFTEVDGDTSGGYKWPEADMFTAGFNHIDVSALAAWFHALPWGDGGKGHLVWTCNGEGYGAESHNWIDY